MFGLSNTQRGVRLSRGVTRDELQAAINKLLLTQYARELWVAQCRPEFSDVTTDDHKLTGRRVIDEFSVPSCLNGYGLSVRFGEDHWARLEDPRTTYDTIDVSFGDLYIARLGLCCGRHELGQPELRPRQLTANDSQQRILHWFTTWLRKELER